MKNHGKDKKKNSNIQIIILKKNRVLSFLICLMMNYKFKKYAWENRATGTNEAEADVSVKYVLKDAIRGVQDVVTDINEHLEEIKYEITALQAE